MSCRTNCGLAIGTVLRNSQKYLFSQKISNFFVSKRVSRVLSDIPVQKQETDREGYHTAQMLLVVLHTTARPDHGAKSVPLVVVRISLVYRCEISGNCGSFHQFIFHRVTVLNWYMQRDSGVAEGIILYCTVIQYFLGTPCFAF